LGAQREEDQKEMGIDRRKKLRGSTQRGGERNWIAYLQAACASAVREIMCPQSRDLRPEVGEIVAEHENAWRRWRAATKNPRASGEKPDELWGEKAEERWE
jgi:hypothetical protein